MGKFGRALLSLSRTQSNIIYATQKTSLSYTLTNRLHSKASDDEDLLSDQSSDISSCNKKLAWYVNTGQLKHARKMFDEIPVRDVVSWNTMLSGLRKAKDPQGVFGCFLRMRRDGFSPSVYTIPLVLNAVLGSGFISVLVLQLHAVAIQLDLHSGLFVGSALMRGYGEAGDPVGLRRVFDEIIRKDVSSWNSLISGYMKMGWMREAQKVFNAMPEKDSVSWTSLINGYIRNKRINKARHFFDMISEKNVVSWTAMIAGYVQNHSFAIALGLFVSMLNSGVKPNHFTFSSLLVACAGCCSLLMGQQVHSMILKSGIPGDTVLLSSLVDMYAKCGDIHAAFCVFEALSNKSVVSWNLIIGAYSRHGLAARALDEFERMTRSGIKPDQVTFINVLSACAHGGLIGEGVKHFNSMAEKYGIQPETEHYACMVDLYGRAGELEEAVKVITGMTMEPDVVVWGALLAASGLHSNLEVGKFAAEGINKLKTDHPAGYSMLSKIHGEQGSWSSVIGLREMIKRNRVRKQNAGSWVEFSHFIPSYNSSLV